MKDLIEVIDNIIRFGLGIDLKTEDKEKDLEEHLVMLYTHYFLIRYEYDDKDYPGFDRNQFPDVVKNVHKNFPGFGFYHIALNPIDYTEEAEWAMGDAVDDLSDIIYDLLEVKWCMENNSLADGLFMFELSFKSHSKHHLINLLNYLTEKG